MCPFDIFDVWQWLAKDMSIQKQQSGESLILCRRGDIAFDCKMREERSDLVDRQFSGMTEAMEMDESFDPVPV